MPIQIQDIHEQEDIVDCPLCLEVLEVDDINFFPCECGYQICRFCWHRIRTDGNGLCPACRKPYPENPAEFKPLTEQELQKIRQEKKQKEVARKQKITDSRKHLANVRVLQKNLVFVVGLSQRLADIEILKRPEYFGKYGKILKVVLNSNTSYAGSQSPSCSAYVTYSKMEEALRAIQSVNNVHIDGRTLKASLGTTKYCSNYLKNQVCQKHDCMYLHEVGDEDASFTKEDMQAAKHQEYEQKLIHQMIEKEIQQEMKAKAMRQETPGDNEEVYTGTSPPSGTNTITSSLSVAQAVKKNTKPASENAIPNQPRRHTISTSSDSPEFLESDNQIKNVGAGMKPPQPAGDKDTGPIKASNGKVTSKRTTPGKSVAKSVTNPTSRHKNQPQQNVGLKKHLSSASESADSSAVDAKNTSNFSNSSVGASPSFTSVPDDSLLSMGATSNSTSPEMISSDREANFTDESMSAVKGPALPIDIPNLPDDLSRRTPLSDASSSTGHRSPQIRDGFGQDRSIPLVDGGSSGVTKPKFMMMHKEYSESTPTTSVTSNGLTFSPFGVNPTSSGLPQDLQSDNEPLNTTQTRMMPPPGLSNVFASGLSMWPAHNSRLPDSMPIQSSHDWEAAFGFKSLPNETVTPADDDLGFDPWLECSKGLADLMKEEKTMKSTSTSDMGSHLIPVMSSSTTMTQPQRPTFLRDRNQAKPIQMGYSGGTDLVNGFSNLFSNSQQMYQGNKMPFPTEQSRFLPPQRLTLDPHPLSGRSNMQKLFSPGSPVTPTKDPSILKGNNGNLQDMQNEFRALLPSVNINFTNQSHSQRSAAGFNNADLSLGLSNLGMPMVGPNNFPVSQPPGIGNLPVQNHPLLGNKQHVMPPRGYSNNRSALIMGQQWGSSESTFSSQGLSSNRKPGPGSLHPLFPGNLAGNEHELSANYPPDPAIIQGGVPGFGQNVRRNRLFESSFSRPSMTNMNNNTAVDEQPHWMKSLQALMEHDTPTSRGTQGQGVSQLGQGFSQPRTNVTMPPWPNMSSVFPSNNSNFSNSQPPPGFQVRPPLTKPTEFNALQNLLENQS